MTDAMVLANDQWRVGVLPHLGASVAFGQLKHDGQWVDFLRPTPLEAHIDFGDCASFVLIPWSNRVRGGLLQFGGTTFRLRVNADDGTAIHGTANEFPWEVADSGPTRAVLSFDSRDFFGVNFPWLFTATVEYELAGPRFAVRTTISSEDELPFPAGFGHHPYFQRTLTGPSDAVQLEVPCERAYVLHRAMPDAAAVPVGARVDFRELRDLGDEFIDDCLTGRVDKAPIRFVYPESEREIELDFDEVYSHVVVYVPQDETFFAVEPVTNANDGFALLDRGIEGSGVFVLEPGESRTGELSFTA